METMIMMSLLATQALSGSAALDVYFGAYTGKNGAEGIYRSSLDTVTGVLSRPALAAKIANPSFIEIHPGGKFLYAVSEGKTGTVTAFAIEPADGTLRRLNEQPSGGSGACHIAINRAGNLLLAANYNSGSVAAIPIRPDGSLAAPVSIIKHQGSSVDPKRQQGPHAHNVTFSPDCRFAFAVDLGLDKIMIYRVNPETGQLAANVPDCVAVKPGAGPRHFTFSPDGRFAYVINELNETVTAYAYQPQTGALTEIQQISTLPTDFKGVNWCAEVRAHPNGKFLYGSNRGHDSIVIYTIDQQQGTLALSGFQTAGIKTPRHFNLGPGGRFCLVANQGSDCVGVFTVNAETGALTPTGDPVSIGKPVCVRFAP